MFAFGVVLIAFCDLEDEEGGWISGVKMLLEAVMYAFGSSRGEDAGLELGHMSVYLEGRSGAGTKRKLRDDTASWMEEK